MPRSRQEIGRIGVTSERHGAGRRAPPPLGGGVHDDPEPRTRHLRLNPILAIALAFFGLALAFGPETGVYRFRHSNVTCGPATAVDMSLHRLMRPLAVQRLQWETA